VFDTGSTAVEVDMPLIPGGFMGSQRLAFWLRKLGWRGEPSRREQDPIEMGTAFGLDASMGPASDWSDSSTVSLVDGGLHSAPPRY
jgi:hypothetical protein